MSADNGVYIAKFPDGYRIANASAIENITYFPEGTEERKEELKNYFGHSKLYPTKEEAFISAHDIAAKMIFVEYGVCYIGEFESFI